MTDVKDGKRSYVFGYVQGCSMIALGMFLGVPAVYGEQLSVGGLGYAALWFLSGLGIVTRWTVYGLVAFYVTLIISVQGLFAAGPTKSGWWMLLGVVAWFGVPAVLYFPRRYLDFLYHQKPRFWERRQREPVDLMSFFPRQRLKDNEVKQVLEHMQERREEHKVNAKENIK